MEPRELSNHSSARLRPHHQLMNHSEYVAFIRSHAELFHFKWKPSGGVVADTFIIYGICTGQTLGEFRRQNERGLSLRLDRDPKPCQSAWWVDWRSMESGPEGWRQIRARHICILHTCQGGHGTECTMIDSKPWFLWVKLDCPNGAPPSEPNRDTQPDLDDTSSDIAQLICDCSFYVGRHIFSERCKRHVVDLTR